MSAPAKRRRSIAAKGAKPEKSTKPRKSTTKRRVETAASPDRPLKLRKQGLGAEKKKSDGSGPLEWLVPMLESAYTPLGPHDASMRKAVTMAVSSFQPSAAALVVPPDATVWRDVFLEYKKRKAGAVAAPPAAAAMA
ncbi:MAG: hypothetical protein WA418_03335, partial [Bradyrhizobium sp.]